MTERRTNRLIGETTFGGAGAPPFVAVGSEQVATDINAYCAWLNAKERRRGQWAIITTGDRRTVEWRAEIASDDWLRSRGMVPKIACAA